MAITKDMSILEVVQKYPDTAEVFMNAGMGCLGCAAATLTPSSQASTTASAQRHRHKARARKERVSSTEARSFLYAISRP